VADYNKYMGYVDSMNHMKVNCCVSLTYNYPWYMGIILWMYLSSASLTPSSFPPAGPRGPAPPWLSQELVTQLAARAKVAARQNRAPVPEPVPERLRKAHIIVRLTSQRRSVHYFKTEGNSCKTSYG